jgi:hypothetical protein
MRDGAMPKTTPPTAKEAALYRLEPIQDMLDREEWAASVIKEACWVKATSEQEARSMVEVETRTRQAHSAIKLPFFSPWSSSAFTSCERAGKDAPVHHGLPAGLVVTIKGPILQNSNMD